MDHGSEWLNECPHGRPVRGGGRTKAGGWRNETAVVARIDIDPGRGPAAAGLRVRPVGGLDLRHGHGHVEGRVAGRGGHRPRTRARARRARSSPTPRAATPCRCCRSARYTVTATMSGFQSQERSQVVLEVQASLTLDFALDIAGLTSRGHGHRARPTAVQLQRSDALAGPADQRPAGRRAAAERPQLRPARAARPGHGDRARRQLPGPGPEQRSVVSRQHVGVGPGHARERQRLALRRRRRQRADAPAASASCRTSTRSASSRC